jgi:hypothetical protein
LEVAFHAFLALKNQNFQPFGSRNGSKTAEERLEKLPIFEIPIVGSCIAIGSGIEEVEPCSCQAAPVAVFPDAQSLSVYITKN